jgi:hypothetical protein
MQLEHLCDMQLAYEHIPGSSEKFVLIRPYGSEEGSGYGVGGGTVQGERLRGVLHWVNHPHRRSDGAMLPDVHGVLRTDDGARVLFRLQGRTFIEGTIGRQLLSVLFETDDPRYHWLNGSFCVLEGVVDVERFAMDARVYRLIHG